MASGVATPWGTASVVEEVEIRQESAGREFASVAQLLETRDGELLVRFAYTTDGTVRRGPVTLRAGDLEALRDALGERRRLARALGCRPPRGRSG
ncbi:MAG: hypothetical protein U0R69_02020 [Gaiellales bacterium]